jgi:FKBP-type peptidyl-prolyl cis-trans isomerase
MKKIISALLLCSIVLVSCDVEGVQKKENSGNIPARTKTGNQPSITSETGKSALKPGAKTVDTYTEKNGLRISWFERGKGPLLQKDEVVNINFEVLLENGTLVDGNQLLNRPSLPFLVGYGLQTKGWDLAFEQLRVGDFAEIFLPAALARGEKGVKGLIPPNAPNIIRVRVLEKVAPTKLVDGTKIWLLEQNKEEKVKAGGESSVDLHYMVGTASNPKYDISYRRNEPVTIHLTQTNSVPGLKKALINAKKSDKLWILVPAAEAYGNKGLVDFVKPGETLFYDVFIMDVR